LKQAVIIAETALAIIVVPVALLARRAFHTRMLSVAE
jgi:hypothetical protein